MECANTSTNRVIGARNDDDDDDENDDDCTPPSPPSIGDSKYRNATYLDTFSHVHNHNNDVNIVALTCIAPNFDTKYGLVTLARNTSAFSCQYIAFVSPSINADSETRSGGGDGGGIADDTFSLLLFLDDDDDEEEDSAARAFIVLMAVAATSLYGCG